MTDEEVLLILGINIERLRKEMIKNWEGVE
jgi:hypothetical protein